MITEPSTSSELKYAVAAGLIPKLIGYLSNDKTETLHGSSLDILALISATSVESSHMIGGNGGIIVMCRFLSSNDDRMAEDALWFVCLLLLAVVSLFIWFRILTQLAKIAGYRDTMLQIQLLSMMHAACSAKSVGVRMQAAFLIATIFKTESINDHGEIVPLVSQLLLRLLYSLWDEESQADDAYFYLVQSVCVAFHSYLGCGIPSVKIGGIIKTGCARSLVHLFRVSPHYNVGEHMCRVMEVLLSGDEKQKQVRSVCCLSVRIIVIALSFFFFLRVYSVL